MMPKSRRPGANCKSSQDRDFKVGTLCFAYLKGYPPWPAKIVQIENGQRYCVKFFGTYDHGIVSAKSIYSFSEENLKRYGGKGDKGSKVFKIAMEELLRAFQANKIRDDANRDSENADSVIVVSQSGRVHDGIFYETSEEDENPRTFRTVVFDKSCLKDFIEEGVRLDNNVKELLKLKPDKNENEKELLRLSEVNEIYEEKLQMILNATALEEIVLNIQVCLDKQRPYLKQAVTLLEALSKIHLTPILILKVPSFFQVMEACRRYNGVRGILNQHREQLHHNYVERIRQLAKEYLLKILTILKINPRSDFIKEFEIRHKAFKILTRDLSPQEKLLLSSEDQLQRIPSDPFS